MIEFPKFKYHETKDAVVVKDADEEKALGTEWANSPAEFGVVTCPNPDEELLKQAEKLDKKGKK